MRISPTRSPAPLTALLLGALYVIFVAPTVGPGDSGEIAGTMLSFGVAHAPGYPLWVLIGNLTRLIWKTAEPALALNLLNAIVHAFAGGFLAAAIHRTTRSFGLGLGLALTLGTSRIFWEYSIAVEVFALNDLATAVLLYLLAAFRDSVDERRPRTGLLYAAAAVMSLTITHHTTLALVAIPVLIGFLLELRALREHAIAPLSVFCRATAVGVLFLLPILYVPIAAAANPALSWDDARDLAGLKRLLLREDFGSGRLMSSEVVAMKVLEHGGEVAPGTWTHNLRFFSTLPEHTGWLFAAAALVGALEFFRRRRRRDLPFVAFALLQAFFFARVNSPLLPLFNGVTERFYLMPLVVWTLVAAIGLARIIEWTARFGRVAGIAVIAAVILFGPILNIVRHHARIERCRSTFTRDLGRNYLSLLPKDAIIFGQGDMLHASIHYQQLGLGYRKDVTYIDLQKLTYDWYVRSLRRRGDIVISDGFIELKPGSPENSILALFDANAAKRPIAALRLEDTSFATKYRLSAAPLFGIAERRDQPPSIIARADGMKAAIDGLLLPSAEGPFDDDRWEADERAVYADALAWAATLVEFADCERRRTHDDAVPAIAKEWLDRAADFTTGGRARVDELHAGAYWRLLVERTLGREPAGEETAIAEKVRRLASVARGGPTGDGARTAIDVRNLKALRASYDVREDLADHFRILDRKSTDLLVLNALIQKVSNLIVASKADESATFLDAINRQARAAEAYRAACRVTENESFRATTAMLEKSVAQSRATLEEYRRRFVGPR